MKLLDLIDINESLIKKRKVKQLIIQAKKTGKNDTLLIAIEAINKELGKVESQYNKKLINKRNAKKQIKKLVKRLNQIKKRGKGKFKILIGAIIGSIATLGIITLKELLDSPDSPDLNGKTDNIIPPNNNQYIAFSPGNDINKLAPFLMDELKTNNSRKISAELIGHFEGVDLKPRYDPVGFPEIGYGHKLSNEKWADLSQWENITKEEALSLFEKDLKKHENKVKALFPDIKDPRKISALTSFSYNVGAAGLENSKLRQMILNNEDPNKIMKEWLTWNKAGRPKKVLAGLTRRRNTEATLFFTNFKPEITV